MRVDDAHRVWCPQYQVTELHRLLNHNRGSFDCETVGGCLGVRCGVWVWEDEESGRCGLVSEPRPDVVMVELDFPKEIRVSNMEEFKVVVENAFAEPEIDEETKWKPDKEV